VKSDQDRDFFMCPFLWPEGPLKRPVLLQLDKFAKNLILDMLFMELSPVADDYSPF